MAEKFVLKQLEGKVLEKKKYIKNDEEEEE
jgi:hypothetical protein